MFYKTVSTAFTLIAEVNRSQTTSEKCHEIRENHQTTRINRSGRPLQGFGCVGQPAITTELNELLNSAQKNPPDREAKF